MNFFSAEDIQVFREVGGSPYRKNNKQHETIGRLIVNGPLAKTEHWANEIIKRLPDFTIEISRHWQRSGYFSRYTWAKVYKPEDKNRDIFFTVGVDREHNTGLVYKLDFQRDDSSTLSVAKKKLCDRLIKRHGLHWQIIDINDFAHYDWGKLINETVNFISQNEAVYDEMVSKAWKRSARICWNDNNWIFPSGKEGKAQQKDSYERLNGYGNEEWLFDFDKLIGGYHYAFLEPVLHASKDEVGESYEVLLWTIYSRDKKRYAVANIRDIEIIDKVTAQSAMYEYTQRGWLKEMEKQVKTVGGDLAAFKSNIIFNVRFKPEWVEVLYPFEIPVNNHIMQLKRYRLNNIKPDVNIILSSVRNNSYEFTKGHRSAPSNNKTTSYTRETREVEIKHIHREISDNLTSYLALKYGTDNVSQENKIGNRRIDVVVTAGYGDIFFEIKTYPSLRTSIREALGQLLEYAYYPEANNAEKLVIVTQSTHSDNEKRDGEKYMSQLRKMWKLPVYLCYFDNLKKELSKEY